MGTETVSEKGPGYSLRAAGRLKSPDVPPKPVGSLPLVYSTRTSTPVDFWHFFTDLSNMNGVTEGLCITVCDRKLGW